MCNPGDEKSGMEAINKLKSTVPPLFISSNPDLSLSSRIASHYLFASLKPYTPKSPFDQLLTDGFDAEQIWQQIDLQSQPLISSLKRKIRQFEKNPDQISSILAKSKTNGVFEGKIKETEEVGLEEESDELEELSDDDTEEEEDQGAEERENVDGEDEEEEGDEDESDDEFDAADGVPEVEDEFLKIKDLEKYLVREEKREYGSEENTIKKKGKNDGKAPREDDDESMDDEDEKDEANDELLLYGEDDGDEDGTKANIRYEDFFVPDKKRPKRKWKQDDESDGSEEDEDDEHKKGNLSTYEKEHQKLQIKIKEMEEANLGPKDWTMQGEVTAAKRPKDSALEADLDFEHNLRPPPVITEEVTTSLEEIIKKRILEGNFDDVKKAPKLSAAPKERKELDDNKSKKGLAEIYEDEYAQQTGHGTAPLSSNDELKNEASKLFKTLCLKLDALSHFHFAPKPVVEDMSVQANVPALAMEEIAPVAVSDAAMLAPEEIFAGKGDIKDETELTKEDRKRRRAKKKRKSKAVKSKRTAERASKKPSQAHSEGKEQ